MNREEYNYWLANINRIGARKIELLINSFGNAEEVYKASGQELMSVLAERGDAAAAGFCKADMDRLAASKEPEKIRAAYAKLTDKGIRFITREEEDYPDRLKGIYAAPFALYVKGKLPGEGHKCLAVVGARECTGYGKEMAACLAGALAREGIIIISGLARGIDTCAHKGALSSGGVTCGVLGCGIDICYPKENINLYMEMQKEGGIISEYAPGMPPLSCNFPMRNRIISGLSDGILVIEAREKSGSLITVDMGLDQGKDIYALPGKATDRLSEGCNNLIKSGAKLVASPEDILEDFLPEYHRREDERRGDHILLEPGIKSVYNFIGREPKHLEEISSGTKLPVTVLTEQLLILEIRGLVRQPMKNYYVLQ